MINLLVAGGTTFSGLYSTVCICSWRGGGGLGLVYIPSHNSNSNCHKASLMPHM